jgi:hypothetical protein
MSKASGSLPSDDLLYAPGLKRRPRAGCDARYFLVPEKDLKKGYPGLNRTIPKNATELEAAAMCREWWADLDAWRKGVPKPVSYTFNWLCDRFQYDKRSPLLQKHPATQKNYIYELNALRESIGTLHFDPLPHEPGMTRVSGAKVREWHENWGCPVEGEDPVTGKPVMVASAPSRARHLVMQLRNIVGYGIEIRAPGCVSLKAILQEIEFPAPRARTKYPTYAQVDAFVNKAEEMGFRSQAIATLAQFELIERRVNIIGQWYDDVWADGWVWEGHAHVNGNPEWVGVTPDWRIRYYQTKKGANLREFDLKPVQRLLGLMQETPKDQRQGAIIVCERTGKPWSKRYYAEIFREIATAAGWPKDLWSMDMRAGGGTEASAIPTVTDRMLQNGFGHRDPKSKERYLREPQHNANKVVELRQAARPKT